MKYKFYTIKTLTLALVLNGLVAYAAPPRDIFEPGNAHNTVRDPLPVNTKVINKDEFEKKVNLGNIHLTNPKQVLADKALIEKLNLDHRKLVESKLGRDPVLLERLTRKPLPNDPTVKKLEDGNYSIVVKDTLGKSQNIITMGDEHLYGELSATMSALDDAKNHWNAYAILYEGLPKEYIASAKLLPPSEVKNFSAADLQNLNFKIAADFTLIEKYFVENGLIPPPGRPANCAQEIGAGARLDQTGGSCGHNPNGIYTKVAYPLRYFATCVKNQGNRGSCVSFGVTGSIETAAAVKYRKWYNFSEQDLYNKAKMIWYPTNFGDGLNTEAIMSNIVTKGYSFPYENAWQYNASYNRIADSAHQTYTHSCDGYSGLYCSDTVHQGQFTCTEVFGHRFCGYTAPLAGSGFKATHVASVWDPFHRDESVNLARLYLAAKIPLTIALPVTPTFDGAPATGLANYVGAHEGNRGSHALSVVGAVTNDKLAAGMPAGAGGGYFVIKNSWGACWKDAGYIYLPFAWIKDYTISLTAMTGIN